MKDSLDPKWQETSSIRLEPLFATRLTALSASDSQKVCTVRSLPRRREPNTWSLRFGTRTLVRRNFSAKLFSIREGGIMAGSDPFDPPNCQLLYPLLRIPLESGYEGDLKLTGARATGSLRKSAWFDCSLVACIYISGHFLDLNGYEEQTSRKRSRLCQRSSPGGQTALIKHFRPTDRAA